MSSRIHATSRIRGKCPHGRLFLTILLQQDRSTRAIALWKKHSPHMSLLLEGADRRSDASFDEWLVQTGANATNLIAKPQHTMDLLEGRLLLDVASMHLDGL